MSKQIFGQKWIILWKKWCKKVMEQECQDMVHDVVTLFFLILPFLEIDMPADILLCLHIHGSGPVRDQIGTLWY